MAGAHPTRSKGTSPLPPFPPSTPQPWPSLPPRDPLPPTAASPRGPRSGSPADAGQEGAGIAQSSQGELSTTRRGPSLSLSTAVGWRERQGQGG